MADQINSVNPSLSTHDSLVTKPGSTGVPLADALRYGMERHSANRAWIEHMRRSSENQPSAGLHTLHDPSLSSTSEGEAGNMVLSPQDLSQVDQPPTRDVINKLHLRGLTTAASGETNPSEKMGAFMEAASMPWESLESKIRPQYDTAMGQRNPFVDAVRENPIAKIAALTFIPTTLPALWALMGGQTFADKALSVVSLAQNEFVINGIKDRSIHDFSKRVREGLDFLNGLEIQSIEKESDLSLKFARLLLEQVMKSEEKSHVLQETVIERDIIGAKELLNELNAFLTKKPEDIISGVKENGGPFALKALVQAVTGVPALLEAKYHAGPQVDSLITTIGINEKQAEEHLKTLDGVGGFFKRILGLQVKSAETVLRKARENSERISQQAAQQIMTGLTQAVNDPETREGINNANINLSKLATQLVQTVSGQANQQLTGHLATVNEAIARASKPNSN